LSTIWELGYNGASLKGVWWFPEGEKVSKQKSRANLKSGESGTEVSLFQSV